jgi:hypothetical protein
MYLYEGCILEEVRIYRELQNEPFDFGSGMIDNSNGGEEAYYEMALKCSNLDVEDIRLQEWFYDYELEVEFDSLKKDMTRAKRRKRKFKRRGRKTEPSSDWTRKTNQNVRYISKDGRNWKPSDKARRLSYDYGLKEYLDGNSFNWNEFESFHDSEIETKIQLREEDQWMYQDYLQQLEIDRQLEADEIAEALGSIEWYEDMWGDDFYPYCDIEEVNDGKI